MRPRRILLFAIVGALCLAGLIAILALLEGNLGETEWKVLASTGGFALASLFAMRGTILLDQGRHRDLGWTVIALSTVALLLELKVVWVDEGDSAVTWKALAITAGFAGALGQIATSLARRRSTDPPALGRLGWAAGACALTVEALIAFAAIEEVGNADYYRFLGAVFILDVLLVALESVVRRLGAPAAIPSGAAPFVCVLGDGRRVRPQAQDRDLPTAVAAALRECTARGQRVRSIELDAD